MPGASVSYKHVPETSLLPMQYLSFAQRVRCDNYHLAASHRRRSTPTACQLTGQGRKRDPTRVLCSTAYRGQRPTIRQETVTAGSSRPADTYTRTGILIPGMSAGSTSVRALSGIHSPARDLPARAARCHRSPRRLPQTTQTGQVSRRQRLRRNLTPLMSR